MGIGNADEHVGRMDGPDTVYLVISSHTQDDLVLRAFSQKRQALDYAEGVARDEEAREHDEDPMCRALSIDATTPVCIKVLALNVGPKPEPRVVKILDLDDYRADDDEE